MSRITINDLDSRSANLNEAAISRITGGRGHSVENDETHWVGHDRGVRGVNVLLGDGSVRLLLPAVKKMGDGSV